MSVSGDIKNLMLSKGMDLTPMSFGSKTLLEVALHGTVKGLERQKGTALDIQYATAQDYEAFSSSDVASTLFGDEI